MVVESSGGALSLLSKLKFLVIYTTLFKTVLLLPSLSVVTAGTHCRRNAKLSETDCQSLYANQQSPCFHGWAHARWRHQKIHVHKPLGHRGWRPPECEKKRGITWCALASTSLTHMRNWQIYKTVTQWHHQDLLKMNPPEVSFTVVSWRVIAEEILSPIVQLQ